MKKQKVYKQEVEGIEVGEKAEVIEAGEEADKEAGTV